MFSWILVKCPKCGKVNDKFTCPACKTTVSFNFEGTVVYDSLTSLAQLPKREEN